MKEVEKMTRSWNQMLMKERTEKRDLDEYEATVDAYSLPHKENNCGTH